MSDKPILSKNIFGEAVYARTQARYTPPVTSSGRVFHSWLPLWLVRFLFD